MSDFKLTEYAHPSETTGLNLCVEVSIVRDLVPFLAHLAKGNVSFCHNLASVIRCLSSVVGRSLTFHIK